MSQAGTMTPVDERRADPPRGYPGGGAGGDPLRGCPAAGGLHDIATSFQAVRLRGPDDLESWRNSFPGSDAHVDLFLDLHRSDPEAAHDLARAVTAMPEVGTEFLGFRLIAELGRGALGRVYLAGQGELANRHVVLKVSPDIDGESQTLAQLQHTNVVPIYSVHRAGSLQAVCMPYFGSTTLADVLKDVQGRAALPDSGVGLISTLVDRKSTVRPPAPARVPPPQEAPAAAPRQPGTSTAVLEMLQGLSYVEAVLWVGARLADGLAHAHEHGILHRDLKPANVLLTDNGQPMLLDFNLAKDTKLAASASAAQVGGTLPFMSPEQLQAYQAQSCTLNYNSDLYSLGVILFELLTGRHPFPNHSGPIKQVLDRMIADRLKAAPQVRPWNPAVSPAVESIVRRCLEPDPAKRYRTARELQEDLERQLDNLPLKYAPEPSLGERARKWVRRHPRLASTTTAVAAAAVVVVALCGALVMRGQRLARLEAQTAFSGFLDDKRAAQFVLTSRPDDAAQTDRGAQACRTALAAYGVLEDPAWQEASAVRLLPEAERDKLRGEVGELLVLLARTTALQAKTQAAPAQRDAGLWHALRLNEQAEASFGEAPKAVWIQRAELAKLLGRDEEARAYRARADSAPLRGATDRYLVAFDRAAQGRLRDAVGLLRDATEQNPRDVQAWFLLGVCHDGLAQYADSVACYSTCVAITPKFPWAYFNRGQARLRLQEYGKALADFDQAIRLRPDLADAYTKRGLAKQGLRDYAGAARDLTRALELGAAPTNVYFLRATVRERAGDAEGAQADRQEGLRTDPTDELGWVTRGYARLGTDPAGALADFDQALRLNPRSLAALQNKANALGRLGRTAEAVTVLDRAVELYPDFVLARAGRGVLLARLGRRDEALRDADESRLRDNRPLTTYQVAGIYALTAQTHPEDRPQAFRLLAQALRQGSGFDLIEKDTDLDAIRQDPEFRELVAAARVIREGGSSNKPQHP